MARHWHDSRAIAAVGALLAGMWLGSFLRNRDAVRSASESEISIGSQGFSHLANPVEDVRRSRPRRQSDGGVTFSRAQWSKLLRNPGLGKVDITECLDATKQLEQRIPVVVDIPVIGRLFDGQISPSPDLQRQAEFFGWDERQTRRVRKALVDFGDQLAEAEKFGVVANYPESGGVRFDFSASEEARKEIARKLQQDLAGILGEKDADRFAILSMMDGLARELPSVYEIEQPLLGPIAYHDPDAPDEDEIIYDSSASGGKSWHDGLDRRFQHLGVDIEWNRLLPKTNSIEK